ncbi:hypothetical protein G7054_g5965 [Neopestalotiopsis clavispora]|nr:hypothetical protein G7054_g5965 [Neopestalotiopsis clavispora]
MRLLHANSLQFEEFFENSVPKYAILSHRWEEGEVSYKDVERAIRKGSAYLERIADRPGWEKIKRTAEQALRDSLEYIWVDTCCIDKTSSAELQESINSMYRWYEKATICYAYLSDVPFNEISSAFKASSWFGRGWTLQELIAPRDVRFFSNEWTYFGNKTELMHDLEAITSIPKNVLCDARHLREVCIANKMRWAAKRQTTRVEDMAYSLLGIFDVNMPLLYGEGKKAFTRLQQEIMRGSDDQTLFAWAPSDSILSADRIDQILPSHGTRGLLADSPQEFTSSLEIGPVRCIEAPNVTPVSNTGVRINLPVINVRGKHIAIIACTAINDVGTYLGFILNHWDKFYSSRSAELFIIPAHEWIHPENLFRTLEVRELSNGLPRAPAAIISIIRRIRSFNKYAEKERHYGDEDIHCIPPVSYLEKNRSFLVPEGHHGVCATVFYEPNPGSVKVSEESGFGAPRTGFGLVFGFDDAPWVVLVPILRPEHEDEDFQYLLNFDAKLTPYCMTKDTLLTLLSQEEHKIPFLKSKTSGLIMILDRWTSEKHEGSMSTVRFDVSSELQVWIEKPRDISMVTSSIVIQTKASVRPQNQRRPEVQKSDIIRTQYLVLGCGSD